MTVKEIKDMSWTLTLETVEAKVLPRPLLLGGGGSGGIYLSRTYIFDDRTKTFSPGPDLPRQLAYHCIAQVAVDRFHVVGGVSFQTLETSAVYDFTTGQWEEKAVIPDNGRWGHFCGSAVFLSDNGTPDNSTDDGWIAETVIATGRSWRAGSWTG